MAKKKSTSHSHKTSYENSCLLCGHKQVVPSFSAYRCEKCRQDYVYDENHVIFLNSAQLDTLRKSKGLALTKGSRQW